MGFGRAWKTLVLGLPAFFFTNGWKPGLYIFRPVTGPSEITSLIVASRKLDCASLFFRKVLWYRPSTIVLCRCSSVPRSSFPLEGKLSETWDCKDRRGDQWTTRASPSSSRPVRSVTLTFPERVCPAGPTGRYTPHHAIITTAPSIRERGACPCATRGCFPLATLYRFVLPPMAGRGAITTTAPCPFCVVAGICPGFMSWLFRLRLLFAGPSTCAARPAPHGWVRESSGRRLARSRWNLIAIKHLRRILLIPCIILYSCSPIQSVANCTADEADLLCPCMSASSRLLHTERIRPSPSAVLGGKRVACDAQGFTCSHGLGWGFPCENRTLAS